MSGTSTDWPRGEWVLPFTSDNTKKPQLLCCPKATSPPNTLDTFGGPTTAYVFPIPDPSDPKHLLPGSYGLNCWVYNPPTNNIQGRLAELHWRKYSAPPTPSITPLFLDSMWRGGGPQGNDPAPQYNGQRYTIAGEMHVFAMARHGKGVNVLFFDGSVRNCRAKDLWQLPWHKDYDINAARTVFPGWMN
jgi:prepilin-type processing-associated H-X9-DG protein